MFVARYPFPVVRSYEERRNVFVAWIVIRGVRPAGNRAFGDITHSVAEMWIDKVGKAHTKESRRRFP